MKNIYDNEVPKYKKKKHKTIKKSKHKHNDDTKGIKEFNLIKEELKLIESMIILYND